MANTACRNCTAKMWFGWCWGSASPCISHLTNSLHLLAYLTWNNLLPHFASDILETQQMLNACAEPNALKLESIVLKSTAEKKLML